MSVKRFCSFRANRRTCRQMPHAFRLVCCPNNGASGYGGVQDAPEYRPGEFAVKLRPGSTDHPQRGRPVSTPFHIPPRHREPLANPNVESVEYNYQVNADRLGNGPSFPQLWAEQQRPDRRPRRDRYRRSRGLDCRRGGTVPRAGGRHRYRSELHAPCSGRKYLDELGFMPFASLEWIRPWPGRSSSSFGWRTGAAGEVPIRRNEIAPYG